MVAAVACGDDGASDDAATTGAPATGDASTTMTGGGGTGPADATGAPGGGSDAGETTGADTSPATGDDAGSSSDSGAVDDDNPSNITPAAALIWSEDYEQADDAQILSDPGIAIGTWAADGGFGPSGGWTMTPDPIDGTADNEDSAGWLMPGPDVFPMDGYELVTVSFMLRMSGPLLDEIATQGQFWSHVNKVFDFKYWSETGGEGGRNGIHFGENPPQFVLASGGAGQFMQVGPDWRTLADEWVWVCFVVDMRADDPADRYLAAYYKVPGDDGVTEMGTAFEDNPVEPLQTYDGHGFAMFFSPLFGYWDDMNGRDTMIGDLSQMRVQIDRVRIADGWPTGDDGPPS